MTQDEMKTQVGQAALHYVVRGEIVGVGTGSTVNKFIDALGTIKSEIRGAVSSSEASTLRLKALGLRFLTAMPLANSRSISTGRTRSTAPAIWSKAAVQP